MRRGARPSTAVAIRAMCSGVVPQQPPTPLTSPSSANPRSSAAVRSGSLVVAAEGVRQPRVRVADHGDRGALRELVQVRAHLLGAERAVDSHCERLGVLDRDPERVDRLAGERPAASVDDRQRHDERQVGCHVQRSRDRGLRVERVEDGLQDEEVRAAFDEPENLLGVGGRHLVEAGSTKRGILHPRRQ